MQLESNKNLHEMLKKTVDKHPEKRAYSWFPEAGKTESVTWQEFYNMTRKVSKSLIALGVEKSDKVNIISYSSFKWVLTDLGITSMGASTVGIYHTNLANDCKYIINHSDAVVVFAEDETQLEKILEIRDEIPDIKKVILMDGSFNREEWVINYDDFLELGKDIPDAELDRMTNNVMPEDTATIVYTSGTTGVPKGAVLTQENATFAPASALACLDIYEDDTSFLFLPLAHIFARTTVYAYILAGVPTTFARSMDTIVDDIKSARPTSFNSVPRIFEKVYSKVVSGAEAKGGIALKIFTWACNVGYKVSDLKLENKSIPFFLSLKYGIATKLVFSKLQAALGGNLRWCISGAAPLEPSIAKFFHAAGILILEGIGMTENMSFTHVNRYDNYRFGWVGLPGPGVEQKIADDGEILLRGKNIMKEYYKMPEETAETITPDGWLRTGDLGMIDEYNFLKVTGRKKELIITSGGKNIAPSAIEGLMVTSKYINQSCVVGDRRNFLTALVTMDADNVTEYAKSAGISYNDINDLITNREIVNLINSEVEVINRDLASFESIKYVSIVPEFTIENSLITPTLKLKKSVIMEKYKNEIDDMYMSRAPETEKAGFVERRRIPERRISAFDNRGPRAINRRIIQRRTLASMY